MDGSLGIFALVCLSVVTGKFWIVVLHRGGSRISGKGVHIVWGFALLILSHFSSISHENRIIWSH